MSNLRAIRPGFLGLFRLHNSCDIDWIKNVKNKHFGIKRLWTAESTFDFSEGSNSSDKKQMFSLVRFYMNTQQLFQLFSSAPQDFFLCSHNKIIIKACSWSTLEAEKKTNKPIRTHQNPRLKKSHTWKTSRIYRSSNALSGLNFPHHRRKKRKLDNFSWLPETRSDLNPVHNNAIRTLIWENWRCLMATDRTQTLSALLLSDDGQQPNKKSLKFAQANIYLVLTNLPSWLIDVTYRLELII